MRLIIQIPNNNIPERTYAVSVLFKYFLGLDIEIQPMDISKTVVSWSTKTIMFEDVLWSGNDCLTYLNDKNLPVVKYASCKFAKEKDIPILYGTADVITTHESIQCGIDVFASIFFMLTRWEEYVVKERDQYDRFIGKNSIAYKNAFLNRPIVNEYVELVWNMLMSLGFGEQRKKRSFEFVLTHDVDEPFMRMRFLRITKFILQSLKNGDFNTAFGYIPDYFKDPYDSYDFLMDTSESIHVKSHFYFMSSHWHTDERIKSPYVSKHLTRIVESIRKRGHHIGFHPGYFSTESLSNWTEEKKWIEEIINQKVDEGRQHYLRFSVPKTFSYWEENQMKIDSTLSYHDVEGFRCGTGDEHPVFDIIKRKEYQLKERPLIIMDGTMTSYQHYSIQMMTDVLAYYIKIGRKYSMPITLLFHNSSFIGKKGRELKRMYNEVLLSKR